MHRLKTLCLILLLSPIFSFAQAVPLNPPHPATLPIYSNPDLPLDQRVDDLVSRMTIAEKVSQMQDVAPAIPRLNIPAYNWWNEALHGVARAGTATVFPQAIGLAATWDTDLLHRIADVISTEARAKYNDAIAHNNNARYYGLTFWSPNINIFRDPRWGRGQETYGEDPFLAGRLAVAFITGLQGDDPHYLKTVATPKHYAVHSGPETLRHRFDVPVSLHDLYDTYTPAFRASIVEAHADSVMCAYNSVLDEPACANHLLFNLLRDTWGFRGYVVSDCGAIDDLHQGHDFVISLDQAAALSVRAGTDLSCGREFAALDFAVQDRLLSPRDIDRSVQRLFEARFRLGMFDPPERVPWSKLTLADVDTADNRKLALQAARESIVLLKNERKPRAKAGELTLPLSPDVKSIAVIGPIADSRDVLLGNYNGTPSSYSTILAGITKHFSHAKINYAVGAPLTESRAVAVPGAYLGTGGPQSQPGVTAEFFVNPRLEGSPVLTRVDPALDSLWNNISPGPGVPVENFSVRWTGALVAPVDGDYRIGAIADGGYRLYFDNKLLVDDWVVYNRRGERSFTVLVHLQAGHAYPIKLEYFRRFRESFARLLWLPPDLLQEAVAVARQSDVVIAVVGITADLEGEERDASDPGFFGGDRTDITLPTPQEQLLEALAATGKPLIVVLTTGSAIAINWANEHAAAILAAWYPGEEGGTAVADILSGDYNPAGRLPITFYQSAAQLPPFTDYSMFNRTYRYLNEPPLFPFGFGLSYSTFSYSNLSISQGKENMSFRAESSERGISLHSAALEPGVTPLRPDIANPDFSSGREPIIGFVDTRALQQEATEIPGSSPITVSARVTNTSKIPGDEVVELYVSHPNLEGAPIRSLAGFQRVHLAAGASQTVSFNLTPRELSVVDARGGRSVPAGPLDLWLGGSQPAESISGKPAQPSEASNAKPGLALRLNITSTTPLPD